MARSAPLRSKAPMKSTSDMKSGVGMKATSFASKPPSPADRLKAQKKALQTATLRALEKARLEAVQAGVDLSEWEAEFLDSVSERVKTYGRAFADPDKGAMNGTLSARQGVKLKEIRKKAAKKATKTHGKDD